MISHRVIDFDLIDSADYSSITDSLMAHLADVWPRVGAGIDLSWERFDRPVLDYEIFLESRGSLHRRAGVEVKSRRSLRRREESPVEIELCNV
ncbi:hypothetical protein AWC06_08940 [Mycobacterium fragae]|uniref:Uncharacterized protein n=2 Tax=Mycobacterium fragae TaxID=1260918 RepID=A0A1X1V2Y7_9MYCO|nr:hypothetical protein AWC06_08940 [Mycobacterium fragae]